MMVGIIASDTSNEELIAGTGYVPFSSEESRNPKNDGKHGVDRKIKKLMVNTGKRK